MAIVGSNAVKDGTVQTVEYGAVHVCDQVVRPLVFRVDTALLTVVLRVKPCCLL